MESLVGEMFHSFSPPSQATAKELSELRPQSCCTSPWSQLHGSSFVSSLFLGTFPSEGFCFWDLWTQNIRLSPANRLLRCWRYTVYPFFLEDLMPMDPQFDLAKYIPPKRKYIIDGYRG